MKPHQLKAFLAVCEQGSIRAAARVLYVSQPAVTRTIRELEADLGVPLVTRSARGAVLTDFGRAFAARARLILEESQRARDELQQMRSQQVGHVRLAASSVPMALLLAPALRSFRREMPLAQLELVDGQLATALTELRHGRLDFALSQHPPEHTEADMHYEPLFAEPLVVCARSGHPRIGCRSLRELLDEEWVGLSRPMLRQVFDQHELPSPARITLCQSFEIARELVQSTDAITVFARPMLAHTLHRHGVEALRIKERLPELPVSIVTRRGAVPTPAARKLLDALRAAAAGLN